MTDTAAESEQDANLGLSLPDRLAININVYRIALRELVDYATAEQRPVADLAAEVELSTTWTRIEKFIFDRARDVHLMWIFVMEARQAQSMESLSQWLEAVTAEGIEKVKEAQERVVRDTYDITHLFVAIDAHR